MTCRDLSCGKIRILSGCPTNQELHASTRCNSGVIPDCEVKRSVRQWISIGRPPMLTILKRSALRHSSIHREAALIISQDGQAFKHDKCEVEAKPAFVIHGQQGSIAARRDDNF